MDPVRLRRIAADGGLRSDDHVTVLVLTTKSDLAKAELVGDRVPDFCLGNPTYRMITVVEFGSHTAPVQRFLAGMARRRLDKEAANLQKRYTAKKIEKEARHDIFAVADFNGAIASQLESQSTAFRVLVFGKNGELIRQWDDVPAAEDLAAALK